MPKITFMGAGSTVFAKNVLGDSMMTPALAESTIALYDIDPVRLNESAAMLWNSVKGREFTVDTLAELLCQEYEVNPATALHDAEDIAQKWIEVGLVE